jgi:hypothetical protein
MTSFKQIEANRRNALKSTGPITEEGKLQSRRNAVRHGLTAETVIAALEDAEDYKAFEAAIVADYDTQSAVERELVLRLASLLWRLRRATAIETGLFEIQADNVGELRPSCQVSPISSEIIDALVGSHEPVCFKNIPTSPGVGITPSNDPAANLARYFLHLANLPNFTLDRLGRYEATLWRQVAQVLFALEALDRRKPQERSAARHGKVAMIQRPGLRPDRVELVRCGRDHSQ